MYRNIALFALLMVVVSGCRMVLQPSEEVTKPLAPAPAPLEIKPLVNTGAWVVTASSQEAAFTAKQAVDGSLTTRWGSDFKDGQWWMVDFGREEAVAKIVLNWEDAYAKKYKVLVSTNGTSWTEVYSQENGQGGVQAIAIPTQLVRQVKVDCIERGTQWGFSLIEVEFNPAEQQATTEATASSGNGDSAAKFAIDGNPKTRWCSNFNDSEWWQVKFAEPRVISGVKILWETAFAEKYEIQVSSDGQSWRTVYRVTEGDGQTDLLFFKPVECQYLRIQCQQRGTGWGNSIWETYFFDDKQAPQVSASSSLAGAGPDLVLDGDPATAWHSAGDGEQLVTIRLPSVMNLGGVEMLWGTNYATAYQIEGSADGAQWTTLFTEKNGNGKKNYDFFHATDVQFIRIRCQKSNAGQGYAIAHLEFKGGEEQATPIRAYQAKALSSKPGLYPMWLLRQQEFWTIVGVTDDSQESLFSETGVIEPHKGDFCVMPFVVAGSNLVTWADVKLEQRLQDEYLPMPSVTWNAEGWKLDVSAVAFGPNGASSTAARYRFINNGNEPFSGQLALAVRPVQLNPIWQHGGMSPITEVECVVTQKPAYLKVNSIARIVFLTAPKAAGAAPLTDGDISDYLAKGTVPATVKASDAEGKTSAGALFELQVPAHGTADVIAVYLLHDESKIPSDFVAAPEAGFDKVWGEQTAFWRQQLAEPSIRIPDQRLIEFMKSNLGYVLINRDDPWFKPGSRNYNHSWMRDGALTGVAMLRMGKADLVRRFIDAFSGFVGDNGWVPFMILEEGKPVGFNANPNSGEGQEYDSQGEFVFIVRSYFDYTGDEALLQKVYPKVAKALRFGQEIRRRRMTDEYKNDPAKQAYYGILPESNSHEGYYPAKHSYWDDFWMLRGLKDGAYLAGRLGETNDVAWMRAEEQDLRACLLKSIALVSKRVGADYVPGCVELGDEDPTSTSIAIMACDEAGSLPPQQLKNTFDRYFERISKRFKGEADTFTPYECRNIDVFVRLGERDRALAMARYFTDVSSRPHNWNELAEVVHAKMRAPSYIGDMPHTWVGSDYINATRSIFAYEKGDSLVLAAGVDPKWLIEGVVVSNLPTQFGSVDYRMMQQDDQIRIAVSGSARPPQGFSIPLPASLAGMSAEINGQPAAITNGELKFDKLPAEARLFTAPAVSTNAPQSEAVPTNAPAAPASAATP